MLARLRKIVTRLAALLLGTVLGVATMELVLRAATDTFPTHRNPLSGFHRPHERLGWLGVENYAARFKRQEFDVVIATDERGFRKPAAEPPRGDVARIAFLGDSFLWGWGVPQGAVFTDHLQAQLGATARVENYGINAFGTGQALLLVEELLVDDPPDVAVLLFCYNDLDDNENAKRGRRPRFRLADGELVREPVTKRLVSPLNRLTQASYAISLLRMNVDNGVKRLRNSAKVWAQGELPVPPGPTRADRERQWKLERALLTELATTCENAGIELRLLYVTCNFDIAGPDGTVVPGVSQFDYRGPLRAICEDLGVALIDPTDALAARWKALPVTGSKGEPFYFSRDEHWTAQGHAAVAAYLAEAVEWPRR